MHITTNMGRAPKDLPDGSGVVKVDMGDHDVLEPIQTSERFEIVKQRRKRGSWACLHQAKVLSIRQDERGHDLRQVLESEIGDLNTRNRLRPGVQCRSRLIS
jgi:hypothetical protein